MNLGDEDKVDFNALVVEAEKELRSLSASEEGQKEMSDALQEAKSYELPAEFVKELDSTSDIAKEGGAKNVDIRTQITKMSLPQKIKAALLGSATARGILIRDGNQLIQVAVLKNPRITQKEIDEFAKNPNVSERVLRAIAGNDQWSKGYGVRSALTQNPKTPIDIAIRFVKTLSMSDLKKVAKSKNVASAIATTARKIVETKG